MKKKRLLPALALSLALGLACLSGCSPKGSASSSASGSTPTVDSSEPVKIELVEPGTQSEPDGSAERPTPQPEAPKPVPEAPKPKPAETPAPNPVPAPKPELDLDSLPGFLNGTVKGLPLPFAIPETPLEVVGVGQYIGPYLEDGSDEPVANVLALVVKNTDKKALAEIARLSFTLNGSEEAVFQITGLPGGEYVLVLEQGRHAYAPEDELVFADKLYGYREENAFPREKVEIYSADGALTVKNLTGDTLDTVYIRYKSKLVPHCYLGGITYSCKVEEIPAGQEKTARTGHFSGTGSQVVMIELI